MLNCVVMPHLSPVVNRYLIIWEVHVVSRVYFKELIDLVLQVHIIHFLKVIFSDAILERLKSILLPVELHRSVGIDNRVLFVIELFYHFSELLSVGHQIIRALIWEPQLLPTLVHDQILVIVSVENSHRVLIPVILVN